MKVTYQEFADHVYVPHGTIKRWALEGLPVCRGPKGKARYPTINLEEGLKWVKDNKPSSVSINRVGFVYLVTRDSDGAVKIGWTSDIERRFQEIRKKFRCAIRPLLVVPGDKPLELEVQARFKHLSIGNEWFHPLEEIRSWVLEALVPVLRSG